MCAAKRDLPTPASPIITSGVDWLAKIGIFSRNLVMAGLLPMISFKHGEYF
jgi:hypothetical protein